MVLNDAEPTAAAAVLGFDAVEQVAEFLKKGHVEFVDTVFADPMGVWHHYTFSANALTNPVELREGLAFDGSSIPLFTSIERSDMLMRVDPSTCWIDPFHSRKTLHVICDVYDPRTGEQFSNCPRRIAQMAVKAAKNAGLVDEVLIGPEPEFFVFDSVNYSINGNKCGYEVESNEGPWNTGGRPAGFGNFSERGGNGDFPNLGHRVMEKKMYAPVAPVDTHHNLRSDILSKLENIGLRVEKHHHEVASGQCEVGFKYDRLVRSADNLMACKYVVRNVARNHNKTATFIPKPLYGDNGSGCHVHQSLWRNGVNLFYTTDPNSYANLSQVALSYIGGILKHAPAICAFTNPTTNSYKRLVPGFEAPCKLTYSQGNRSAAIRIPLQGCKTHHAAAAHRLECRFPDASSCPYLSFAAILLAGIDGIRNDIQPPPPTDGDISSMSRSLQNALPSTPSNLSVALDALETDHEFLLFGNSFTENFINQYISLKREEIASIEAFPHPKEFQLYYHL